MMRQSHGLVISKHEKGSHGISEEGHIGLLAGGQLEGPEKFLADINKMSQGNEAFLRSQGLDPEQMVREAQERDAAKHEMTVGSGRMEDGHFRVVPPIDPSLDEPEVTRLQQQRAAVRESALLVGTDGRPLQVVERVPVPEGVIHLADGRAIQQMSMTEGKLTDADLLAHVKPELDQRDADEVLAEQGLDCESPDVEVWTSTISDWLQTKPDALHVRPAEIITEALGVLDGAHANQRVTAIMTKLGWAHGKRRVVDGQPPMFVFTRPVEAKP
jgi:hypothetical protein